MAIPHNGEAARNSTEPLPLSRSPWIAKRQERSPRLHDQCIPPSYVHRMIPLCQSQRLHAWFDISRDPRLKSYQSRFVGAHGSAIVNASIRSHCQEGASFVRSGANTHRPIVRTSNALFTGSIDHFRWKQFEVGPRIPPKTRSGKSLSRVQCT